jgi:mannose-1-phosphate guanylyltransferase
MAGGSGTRFWPESLADTPKQLLRLVGDRTMIQMTVDRLGDLVTPERVLIVTNERLTDAVAEQLPKLPAEAIIGEPCKRDTAPAIGLAAMHVSRDDPDATMIVMPADHVIQTDEVFQKAIRRAVEVVEQRPGCLVTFGVSPNYPAQTFGYIERGEPLAEGERAFAVKRFREKPDAKTAQEYVDAGSFYWNSGIFVWKAKTILDALAEHQQDLYRHLEKIAQARGTSDFADVFRREFAEIRGVSIDYAVMENAKDIVVLEAPFQWDDVGSWQALARLHGEDDHGNTIVGKHLGLNTTGTIVRTVGDHLVVTLGVNDCVVVHTPHATLVADKHQEEAIRDVVAELKERGWEAYL